MDALLTAGIWLVAFVMFIWLCVLFPAELAEQRNRSQALWVLVAILGTPLLAVALLIYLGEKKPQ